MCICVCCNYTDTCSTYIVICELHCTVHTCTYVANCTLLKYVYVFVRYLRGRIKAGTHGLSAVERAYGRLWSMADRIWQIEHRGEFRLALRRATCLPRGNKRDYVSYKTLVRWRFACALRGSARGFWFIDPLGLRPRGLCTVATRACHVNHAPPSYNYNIKYYIL